MTRKRPLPNTVWCCLLPLMRWGCGLCRALPVQAGLKPRLLAFVEAEPWLAALLPAPPRTAFACNETECRPVDASPTGENGTFTAGRLI